MPGTYEYKVRDRSGALVKGELMGDSEVLVPTPGVRNLIREGKTHQIYSIMQAGGRFGMQTMDQSLANLVKAGRITQQLAYERCHDPEELNRLIGGGGASFDGGMGAAAASGVVASDW